MISQNYIAHRAKIKKLRAREDRAELFQLMGITLVCTVLALFSLAASFHLLSMYI